MKKVVLSLSGGMDSTSLLLRLLREGKEVYALTFDYGQKHRREIQCAKKIVQMCGVDQRIVDVTSITQLLDSSLTSRDKDVPEGFYMEGSMKSTVVPSRNSIFLSLCYGYAQSVNARAVAMAAHSGDHYIYPDCRVDFFEKMEKALQSGSDSSIYLDTPYINMDKAEILQDAMVSCSFLGLDFNEIMRNTWTSYDPSNIGYTGSDVERILAFDSLGLQDPFSYPDGYDTVLRFAKQSQEKYTK